MVAEGVNMTNDGKTQTIKAQYQNSSLVNFCCYKSTYGATGVAEPIRVGDLPNEKGEISGSQATRIYSTEGKSVNRVANGGGQGAKTGLYAVPVNTTDNDTKARTLMAGYYKYGTATLLTNKGFKGGTTAVSEPVTLERAIPDIVEKYGHLPEMFNAYNRAEITDKSPTSSTGSMVTSSCATNRFESIYGYAKPIEWDENGIPTKAVSCADGKAYTVYEVTDGQITIKGKQYPIKLADGYYIIRKLTVTECCRLQTLPDDYCKAVSNSQAYKGLGNGWTAEVIIHILNGALKDVPRDEEIIVLSLYDGIGTGRYCLDKMGFTNVKYYAYEIDPYPIKVSMDNYPDIIQCGDAFAVRNDDWKAPHSRSEWLDELLADCEVS
jgi:DNA (cytosine-5)-methyltransferase 3A